MKDNSATLISWSARNRARYLQELRETRYDVLIIGGGITGGGILRALGLRGIKAALIEKEDFAFGTSSKSTRLAHGGVRYILHDDYGLVWEETHERDWMRRAFPNLVRPVPILIINNNREVARFFNRLLRKYDLLSGWRNYKNYRHITAEEVMQQEPNIRIPNLHSGALFYECITIDSRLTAEMVKEGVMLGGSALNYVRAKRILSEGGQCTGVEAEDRLTGDSIVIHARNVVNATGPWTDELMPEERKPMIRPAKGVHIVVKRESIGNRSGLYVISPVDGRSVFILAHGDYTYIGTTDTDYHGDLDECYTEREEYEYFKSIINTCFPDARFEESDLIGTYAGSRPLVTQEGVSPDKTSRREFIDEVSPGFFVIAGGKLTIFRSMAEKLLSFMAKRSAIHLKRRIRDISKSRLIIGMTTDEWERAVEKYRTSLDEKIINHLYENYGRGGIDILESAIKNPALGEPIAEGQPNIWAELDYCLEYEMITRVRDFLLRRTNLSLHQRNNHEELGRATAERMASVLGWNSDRINEEVAEYVRIARRNSFFISEN
jgi:glycerol-3-phosphate dehydrogenase